MRAQQRVVVPAGDERPGQRRDGSSQLTQQELADRVGLERTSITNIESGRQNITESTLRKIAEAMGYEVTLTFRKQRRPVG